MQSGMLKHFRSPLGDFAGCHNPISRKRPTSGCNKFTGRVAALVDAVVENGVAISAKKEEK